ncbi:MAG: epoxyqueuosine reductase QueH [Lentisphaeria bacterium]|nr:epoxyqueuosine reductase QueH [Lentisphaeria bacterium]
MDDMRELFLHICCAPCGGGCIRHPDLSPGRNITLVYSNSNLDSETEFEKRLHEVKRLAAFYELQLIVDPYDHEAWLQAVRGLENEPEGGKRCQKCFEFNLKRTSKFAGEKSFATTLTVSPRKASAAIFEIGMKYPNFEKVDFKKKNGYLTGRNFALEQGFYRQNYCGCEFSRREPAVNQKEFQL